METSIYTDKHLSEIVKLLACNEPIAFPTETVFGLGTNAYSNCACQKIYDIKKRPTKNPLIVHIASLEFLDTVAKQCPQWAYDLFEHFSPGPLTIVLQKISCVSPIATAGLSTVAVRIPSHPIAHKLLSACPFPLVAPSANRSGRPSPTCVEMVISELQGLIPAILDGEPSLHGIESTIIGEINGNITILRPGSLIPKDLAHVLGSTPHLYQPPQSEIQTLQSPGRYYPHYRPQYPIYPIAPSDINHICKTHQNSHCGLFILNESLNHLRNFNLSWEIKVFKDTRDYAKQLYKTLVAFESHKICKLFAELPEKTELGLALHDRLHHAAAPEI